MKITAKRFYYIMIACLVLLVVAIILSAATSVSFLNKQEEKLAAVKIENQAIEQQRTHLAQAKQDLEKYTELSNIARSIVPQDKDQAKTVREINAIAAQSGIKLQTINFQASNLGAKKSSSSSSAQSDSKKPAAKPPSGLTQVTPVEGIPGVFALEITISSQDSVPYHQIIDFLERLESNRRTAHVQKVILNPDEGGNNLSFVLTLNSYVKP